jgi:hypothetical protein
MTWTAWVALAAAQITVVWVVVRMPMKPRLYRWEHVVFGVLLVVPPVLDGLVLFGVLGRGWPIAARTSFEMLVAAWTVYLVDDAIWLATPPPAVRYPMETSPERFDAMVTVRGFLIRARIVGIVVFATIEAALFRFG